LRTRPTKIPRRLRWIGRVLAGALFAGLAAAGASTAGEDASIDWQVLETRYTAVFYQSTDDLARFDRQLKYDPSRRGIKGLLAAERSDSLADNAAKKVDALFERVQEILDMRRALKKPTILVHPDRKRLHEAYRQLYGRPCKIRAWYHYGTNAIYLNVRDLHEGMLAHAIIDHYLLVRPPAATAEILARYVDSHLKD
jgi:hypothetical protein